MKEYLKMKNISLCRKLTPYYKNGQIFLTLINRNASSGVNLFSDDRFRRSTKASIEEYWGDKVNIHKFNENDNIKKKFYVLSMFPYPSGSLHMGHIRVYTISDSVARFYRMKGYNVLHPMGWDAFGLPAENAAIEKGIHPNEWTVKNIQTMKEQLHAMNYCFDWDREFATCNPDYYRWTQELFLKLFDKGLVYQKEAFVNWDPVDQTVLAEEQVDANNCSWRSGAKVQKKLLKQWFIRTTPFAKSLWDGLSDPTLREYRDVIKMQKHWIGDCTGASFELQLMSNISEYPKSLNVWTNVPEFMEYAKFVAISPNSLLNRAEHTKDVCPGIKVLDAKVINPFSGAELPVFVTEKVIFPQWRDTHIGIPSASMEDLKFSEMVGIQFQRHSIKNYEQQQLKLSEILNKAREWKIGGYPVSPRLQDWPISRQRYWGTPVPIIHCQCCGVQPVPREQLPVLLPKVKSISSGNHITLRNAEDWLKTTCPKCNSEATREADTMDTFVDSSWYFLRYIDPKNTQEMFSVNKAKKMFPVDLYVGGKEHAVLHLYYARFISHFLHSEGLLPSKEPFQQLLVQGMVMGKTYRVQSSQKYLKSNEVEKREEKFIEKATGEPVTVGWEKMSKSKFNGVDPNDLLNEYGIDTTRLLILADVAPTSPRNWSTDTVTGVSVWQNRIWRTLREFINYRNKITADELKEEPKDPKFSEDDAYMFDSRNYFLKTATHSIEKSQQLSVAISRMQGLTNSLHKVSAECKTKSCEFERALAVQIIMLAPIAPHFASELWAGFCSAKHHLIGNNEVKLDKDVLEQDWPEIDMDYKMVLHVHLTGTLIVKIKVPRRVLDQLSVDAAMNIAKKESRVQKRLDKFKLVDVKLLSEAGWDAHLYIITKKHEETVAL